jgi:glycosyltransferase involved in cell wall biosynthesis
VTPTFSIITPVYEPPPDVLAATIDSVLAQRYPNWELCLVDDASPSGHVWATLERYAAIDPRIKIARRGENGGIARASNDALALATGEFLAFLDHDDVLVPDALNVFALELAAHAPVDFAYSDEAKLLADGRLARPFYKPDWSPERMRSQMFTGHLSVMRRSIVAHLGGFRPEFDGAQDYDLVLRVTERTDRILHVAEALYLWREGPGWAALDSDTKPWAIEAGRRAVQEHCERVGIDALVEMLPQQPGCHRVRRRLRTKPLVSIVIPTRGSAARVHGEARIPVLHAVSSVLGRSSYTRIEFVVVAERETPSAVVGELQRLGGERLRLLWSDGPSNFSAEMNAGVAASSGEVILLVDDDVEVVTPDWIEVLTGLVQEPDCGLAGCKLLFADGTLQHGGHVYFGGSMDHAYMHYPGDERGMARMLLIERECSGVTVACAALRREVWEEAGGLCEQLPANFNDVDLSLKIRGTGRRVVWTPHAVLHHFERSTRVTDVLQSEIAFIRRRWEPVLHHDPYFNPNLDPTRPDWVTAKPPEAWVT